MRKKLEEERHELVTQLKTLNPDFKPPADYKPPEIKIQDKIMIPQGGNYGGGPTSCWCPFVIIFLR